jgi:DNA-binding FadR family transcriptional regulator
MTAGVDLAAVLRPVRQGNAFEETVERLLTVIKLGMIPAGDRFPPERELAAQLGISRLTLREALAELQKAGYVSVRRGRLGGTFVTYTPPAPGREQVRRLAREDGAKLADALTFRLAVEAGAAEILAQTLGGAEPRAALGAARAGPDGGAGRAAGPGGAGVRGRPAVSEPGGGAAAGDLRGPGTRGRCRT